LNKIKASMMNKNDYFSSEERMQSENELDVFGVGYNIPKIMRSKLKANKRNFIGKGYSRNELVR
jgi:hypothetical protein